MHPFVSSTITTEMPFVNVVAQGTPATVMHSGCDVVDVDGTFDGVGGCITIVKGLRRTEGETVKSS